MLPQLPRFGDGKFHTPAVVQQQAEQAEQDEGHASQYSQQEHGVVHADVLCKHRTCWSDGETDSVALHILLSKPDRCSHAIDWSVERNWSGNTYLCCDLFQSGFLPECIGDMAATQYPS